MTDNENNPMEEELSALKKERDELHEQIEALQKEKDELFAKLQRVSADYANFQKRVPRQVADSIAYEKEKLIRALLPMLDNFERTLEQSHTAESVEVVLQGVQMIHDHMLDVLRSQGIEQIDARGEKFDPSQHEAVMRREDPEREDHMVLEVFQKGYRMNDRILRPSRVSVNRIPSAPEQNESPEPDDTETPDDFETTDTE
jgi:molecular chaperone GrpE